MPKRRSTIIATAYERLLQIGKVAGALTFLFGIPYGLWQYVQKERAARVEQSLRLFDKFNAAPFVTYREEIARVVTQNADAIAEAAKDAGELEKTIIGLVRKNEKIEPHLWLIMDFFDGVTVCVVNNLCDAATVEQLLAERARDFYEVFYPYIQMRRGGANSKFAIGLETVATAGLPRKTPP
jgi:hypothetical protein